MSDDPRIAKPTITTTLRQDWHSVDACKPLRNPMAELRSENDVLRAENERLRRENAGLRGGYVTFPTCDPDTVLRMPVAKFRLTDAEREALHYVRGNLLPDGSREGDLALDAICGLMKRHGTLGSE